MSLRKLMLCLCPMLVLASVASASLPHSALSNGSFDADLAGWALQGICAASPRPSHAPSGATPTGGAAFFPDDPQGGCYLTQPIRNVDGRYVVSWWAQVLPEAGANTPQGIGVYGSPVAPVMVAVLWTDRVEYRAFASPYQTVREPFQAGSWHHFLAFLDSANATSVLFLDGVPVAVTTGSPLPPPTYVWFGDGDNYPTRLDAPDVLWDEVYVGPFP